MFEILNVNAENVDEYGFFCMRSKPKSKGYQNKLAWLKERFKDGLKVKILLEEGRQRGFIEYIPGEFTWRAINAKKYMVIHCFWIVGKSKGKGYGSKLLEECIKDARELHLDGIAIVTSKKSWLPDKTIFEKKGFNQVDKRGDFELMAYAFQNDRKPSFIDWPQLANEYDNGITVFKSNQCPFTQDAVDNLQAAADEHGLNVTVLEMNDNEMVQHQSPTPFGVFTVIYNGEIITYHPETKNKFLQLIEKQDLKRSK
ncbi:GNAT family N-acetyltransferase [Niallia circulans]|uniref:GNAT family N-acetyltransferase n=1 Tax=Niallia circulans TaxID=1397 RepID=UPI00397E0F05